MTTETNRNWLKGLLAALALCSATAFSPLAAQADDALTTKMANREQLTNVPTIYLTIPLDDIAGGADSYGKERDDAGNDLYRRATIEVVDASGTLKPFSDDGLSIKVRGNSTANPGNGKYAYRLKFDKDVKKDGVVVASHKHDLLGSGYKKRNWTLLANRFDNSMLRNALTYHLGQYVGMPFCPGYRFVDLVINGSYRGTYQVSDHVEVGSHRVDINEDEDWFLEGVAWDTQAEEPYVGAQPAMCIKNPEPKTDEGVAALKAEVSTWREQWLASFDNGTFGKWNDMESLVRYYVAINITGDIDGWFVFKGYRTPTGPFTWGPLWDKDLAYGNCTYASDTKMVEEYSKCNFEWKIQALQKNSKFMKAVKAKMDELVADGLADKLCQDIDRMAAEIDQSQQLNFQKYNINDTGDMTKAKYSTYGEYVSQLKKWVTERISFVSQQVNTLVENLPKPAEATYKPSNMWWYTELSTNTNYNLAIENGHALQGGQWNTFCLPFDATQEQMEQSLGCTYELRVHSGMAADGKTMLFTAPTTKDVEAGVPYLIKPAADVKTYGKFDDVIYSVNVNNSNNNAYNGEGVTTDGEHYFCASLFHGYEVLTTTDYLFPNDLWADGLSLVKATSKDPHDGMRCFVRAADGSLPAIAIAEATVLTGDVNGDGAVTIADVTALVNSILGHRPEQFDALAADVNGDGTVTIADLTALVNRILKN